MHKFLLAVSIFSLFFYSCKTDFDITSDWEDISIIYGLLDPSDTAQYIKINKAFLDKTTSALVIAKIPDSLYYKNINVQLQQYLADNFIKTIQMEQIDGNLEGFVKDTGIFANAPNFLYKTKEVLDQNSSYQLLITESENGKQVNASTEIINDFNVQRPTGFTKVNFFPGGTYKTQWSSAKDGKLYALTIRFYYKEVNFVDTTLFQEKYLDWPIFSSLRSVSTVGGQTMESDIAGDAFYSYLNSQLTEDPSVFRISQYFNFMFSVGGEELDIYNQVTLAQQGITSGSVQPEYTNIENGLGLFSSRFHKTVFNVPIDVHTIDTLACGQVTSHLRFMNSVGDLCF
ncbi:MAG: hypothetical protein H0V61_03400 [Chitinophagales bacterium]|jgi:hypothetical protein|nr:hypothetical protein [Chitinophagales bacterium]